MNFLSRNFSYFLAASLAGLIGVALAGAGLGYDHQIIHGHHHGSGAIIAASAGFASLWLLCLFFIGLILLIVHNDEF